MLTIIKPFQKTRARAQIRELLFLISTTPDSLTAL